MKKIAAFLYGLVAYAVFFFSFLYAIGFTGNFFVPKSIDSGLEGAFVPSLAVNLLLLGLFAIQHSVMARQGFKKWWTQFVPRPIERSTYVLIASLLLLLLFWQWRPISASIWSVENSAGQVFLWGIFWLGWVLVLVSTFLIDHFDLFGLRQVFLYARGKPYTPPAFKTSWIYRCVRHPIMLGFLIAFWATPVMTAGHLVFSLLTTGYILVGIFFEERDLLKFHGPAYEAYRKQVPALLPSLKKRKN